MLARAVQQLGRPTAVSPADQLNGSIALAHGFSELNGCRDRLFFGKGGVAAVGSLVSKLPELNVVRRRDAVGLALGVLRVIGVCHPIGGFAGVAGAIALAGG